MVQADFNEQKKPWENRSTVSPLHRTWTGRVKYPRKKHKWTLADAERIVAGLKTNPDDQEPDFTWFEKIINYLAKFMMEKVIGTIGLKEKLAEIIWAGIMRLFLELGNKIMPNGELARALQAYDISLRRMIEAYTSGDYTMGEAILMDILSLELKEE